MKLSLVIAFSVYSLLRVAAQDQIEVFCREEADTQRSPCGYFMCLVENGSFRSAYSLIVQGVVDPCEEPLFLFAKSKVLASNGVFDEAEEVLGGLLLKFPEDRQFLQERSRQRYLKLLGEKPPAVEVVPFQKEGPTPEMIAWIYREEPIILAASGLVDTYFPRKQEVAYKYRFRDPISSAIQERQGDLISRIQKQGYAELGPGTAWGDSLLLYTAVVQKPFSKKDRVANLGLYAIGSNQKRPKAMELGAENADNGFPALSADGKVLIFSSSESGGKGGMDLYKSVLINEKWSQPTPLSERINTSGHELYPEILGDTLFFTSNRQDLSYGGMDIFGYSFSLDSLWNLGYPVNTMYDDFRIAFSNSLTAYMVSNRPGQRDGDKVLKLQYEDPEIFFKGIQARAQWPEGAVGRKVTLTNVETGAQSVSTITGEGLARFSNVKGESNYELAVEGIDLPEGFKLELLDQNGELIKALQSNATGKFAFVLLSPNEYRLERYADDDESLLTVDILGRVQAEEVPDEGFQIILLDSSGTTIGNTYTSESGDFAFRSVSPNDTYIIKSEVLDANIPIHILDDAGNVINTIQPDANNQYVYVRLGKDDRIITLTNELKQKVKISDTEQFEIGSVYFDLNDTAIDIEGSRSLSRLVTILRDNPHVNVEMSGHTDSRGTATYNEKLSQQRIEAVLRFLEEAGVDANRVKGKGYGESRLKNHCADGVTCSDEQHAENRRTEFRLYQSENNQ